MAKIRTAIIPVAGSGTRFLPATKALPKEMLPIVDKPIIQFLVEEAVAAGITNIIFVTGRGKRAIEDHFDYSFELTHLLKKKKNHKLLEKIKKIADLASFSYVRQPQPLGDGQAILMARPLVGDEPVAIMFGDDLVDSRVPVIKQLMKVFEKYGDPVIAVEKVPKKEVDRYGVIKGVKIENRTYQVEKIVEKPPVAKAPSNLAVIGKYIITPDVFDILASLGKDRTGEIRLAGALAELIKHRPVYAYEFEGDRYDCGDKLGFLKATINYGLKHRELKADFKKYLKSLKI
ncbi:MAG TPA: UTP--glucose-1-phosphate uridylyltransferase GalU [Patescibacteria group bacterium]